MSKVTVYPIHGARHEPGEPRQARRWGTREAIEGLKGSAEILEDIAAEIDVSAVDSIGFTALDFDPRSG